MFASDGESLKIGRECGRLRRRRHACLARRTGDGVLVYLGRCDGVFASKDGASLKIGKACGRLREGGMLGQENR